MPTPTFQPPQGQQDTAQLQDWIVKLIRDLNYMLGNLDTLNVNRLDAKVVTTGLLNAALVTIKSLLNAGAYVQIDSTGMKIFDGVKNTFIADVTGLVTMTGALIQSAAGYPRVEINGTNNALTAYKAAGSSLAINPNTTASVPGIEFVLSTVSAAMYLFNPGTPELFINTPVNQANIDISSGLNLILSASGNTNLAPSGNLQINGTNGYTGFIDVVTSVTFGPTGGGSYTTKRINISKGIVTSVV